MDNTLILRIAVAVILLTHSIPVMLNNGVNDFGNGYLNPIGFAPFGLLLAWSVKISHVVCAILLVINKFVKIATYITLFILTVGIAMIHFEEGWFVVGNGRNGMEFSFLLICVLLSILYQHQKSTPSASISKKNQE